MLVSGYVDLLEQRLKCLFSPALLILEKIGILEQWKSINISGLKINSYLEHSHKLKILNE
jgi:hypothetical protein